MAPENRISAPSNRHESRLAAMVSATRVSAGHSRRVGVTPAGVPVLDRDINRATGNCVKLEMVATVDAPGTARRAIAEMAERAGASTDELNDVRTLVSEVVTNVVRHAYDGAQPGLVYVDASVIGSDLTILVADNGRGPRVASPNPGLGLGWKLVAQLTDRWAVTQRGDGGTMLYMRLRLAF